MAWKHGKLSKWVCKGLYTEVKVDKNGEKIYKIRFVTRKPYLFEKALKALADIKGVQINYIQED